MAIVDAQGQTLGVGDRAVIGGTLISVNQNTINFINCEMQLSIAPIMGGVTVLHLNTVQTILQPEPEGGGSLIAQLDLDEWGRPVDTNDPVNITGTIVGLRDGADFNILFELDQLMPPTETRLRFPLNGIQVYRTQTALTQRRLQRLNQQVGYLEQGARELYE
jgi:hypothetical protein